MFWSEARRFRGKVRHPQLVEWYPCLESGDFTIDAAASREGLGRSLEAHVAEMLRIDDGEPR